MPHARRLLAWVTAAVFVAALAGCAIVRSSLDTTRALQSDGFGNVRVVPSAINGGTTVVVTGEAPPGSTDPERLAAQDVWTHFAFRFVALDVRLAHRPAVSYGHDQLAATFGPRPPGFDGKTIGGSVGRIAAIVVGIGSVVVLFVVGLVAFLVVRHRRRHPRTPPAGWPGYGPYGPPPPGYGQPPGQAPPAPGYGQPPGYGPPPGYSPPPGYGPPPGQAPPAPGYGPPPGQAAAAPGYGPPPGYGPAPGYSPPPGQAPPAPGYSPPPGYGQPPAPTSDPAPAETTPSEAGPTTERDTYGYRGGPPAPPP